jgi:hypothetical protein
MTSINHNKCIEIMGQLGPDARFWGKYIDEFLRVFSQMTHLERQALIEEIPAKTRYEFMCQYIGHFRRTYSSDPEFETSEMLRNAFFLLILDNFDFDYRETKLRVNAMFEQMKDDGSEEAISVRVYAEMVGLFSAGAKQKLGTLN